MSKRNVFVITSLFLILVYFALSNYNLKNETVFNAASTYRVSVSSLVYGLQNPQNINYTEYQNALVLYNYGNSFFTQQVKSSYGIDMSALTLVNFSITIKSSKIMSKLTEGKTLTKQEMSDYQEIIRVTKMILDTVGHKNFRSNNNILKNESQLYDLNKKLSKSPIIQGL